MWWGLHVRYKLVSWGGVIWMIWIWWIKTTTSRTMSSSTPIPTLLKSLRGGLRKNYRSISNQLGGPERWMRSVYWQLLNRSSPGCVLGWCLNCLCRCCCPASTSPRFAALSRCSKTSSANNCQMSRVKQKRSHPIVDDRLNRKCSIMSCILQVPSSLQASA